MIINTEPRFQISSDVYHIALEKLSKLIIGDTEEKRREVARRMIDRHLLTGDAAGQA
jgi:hypothetical protein